MLINNSNKSEIAFPANPVDPELSMRGFYSIKLAELWSGFISTPISFWFISFYLFIEYVRPQTIYPAIDILPYGQLSIILALTAHFLDKRRIWVKNIANKLITLFLITIIISGATSTYPEESLKHWIDFTQWFFVYFLIINIVNTEKKYFLFYFAFLIYSFKMSQHGFFSWAQRGFAFEDWGVTGAPGWFHNSGEFGIQLCVFLPLTLYFILALRKYWGKLKYIFFLTLPFTAIASAIASSSRGALVGIAAVIVWMIMKSRHKFRAVMGAVFIGFVVYYNIPPESMARFETAGEDVTSVVRKNRWADGLDMLNKNPIFGIGYRNWDQYYPTHYFRPSLAGEYPYGLPHNVFIDAGAELGYTGLLIFILMIFSTLLNNSRTRKFALQTDNKFIFWTANGLDAAMIGFLVSGSFVSVLFYPYFWINLAMTVSLNNIAAKQARPDAQLNTD